MDYKAFMEAIVAIENECDINGLKYGEIEMWPLIRSSLHMGIYMEEGQRESLGFSESPVKVVLRKYAAELINSFTYKKYYRDLEKKGPVDFLFYSRARDHADNINGKFFERHIDPLIELVRGKYSFCKLELSEDNKNTLPRHEPTCFINPRYFLSRRTIGMRSEKKLAHIHGFANVHEMIKKFGLKMYFDEEGLINTAHSLTWWIIFFSEILETLRPKAVFLVYYPGQQALISACKKLNIKTIDIQHGFLAEYHPMYTHWTRMPEKGYNQLPDFFWLWDQKSSHYISDSRPDSNRHHCPVVGGNRWLTYWKHNKKQIQDVKQEGLIRHLRAFKKVILVACGGFALLRDSIPEHVEAGIKNAPAEWFWLIRLHHSQRNRKDEVNSFFTELGVRNFEVDLSSTIALFTLLDNSTDLVTACSSVCYEALAFGVPSTIVHPTGLQFYKEFIDKGIFAYATEEAAFMECIRTSDARKIQTEEHSYIETSDEKAELALKTIMDSF